MPNYTYLHQGDRLPTVGVVQRILNSQGISIAMDGIYGRETAEAVRQFQYANGLRVSGIIEQSTWAILAQIAQLSILDCIDASADFTTRPTRLPTETDAEYHEVKTRYEQRVASLYENEYRDITAVGGDPVVMGGASDGVGGALAQLARRTDPNPILLRFHGHGSSGMAGISTGEEFFVNEGSVFDMVEVRRQRNKLEQIGDKLYPSGSVQFMHCSTGHGSRGRAILQEMANMMQVPVTAAIIDQLGGGLDTFRFEGTTYTAVPGGGSLRTWCRNLESCAVGRI